MSRTLQAIRTHLTNPRRDVRAFVVALVVGLTLLPVAEAIAFYAATGTGAITGATATVQATTVALSRGGAFTGSSVISPGQSVTFPVQAICLTACPATVTTVSLSPTWSSDKTGCDPTAFPNSFSMPQLVANVSGIGSAAANLGNVTITWANLGVLQNACSGAAFTWTLNTP